MNAGGGNKQACRPRVLIVGPVPPPVHGVTAMTASLLEAGLDDHFELVHADTSDHRDMGNVGRIDLANVVLAVRHWGRFVGLLRRRRPDLIYLPLSQGGTGFLRDATLLLTARAFDVPVAIHAHGARYRDFFERVPSPLRWLVRASLNPVKAIAVLGDGQRGQFAGWAPAAAHVVVIPNGVADDWPEGPPSRLGRPTRTVLYLGNLLPAKGFEDVLWSAPSVASQVPGVRFVFAGEPWYDSETKRRLEEYVVDRRLADVVTFTGRVDVHRRRALLDEADALVFVPRWEEGQGIVAVEAMSAGLPVVFAPSGGLAETLRGGIEGLEVPKGEPSAVADALIRLLTDEALRLRLGAAGRTRYEAEYTLESWVHRMLAFLRGAVETQETER